jgi:hypothetical protein
MAPRGSHRHSNGHVGAYDGVTSANLGSFTGRPTASVLGRYPNICPLETSIDFHYVLAGTILLVPLLSDVAYQFVGIASCIIDNRSLSRGFCCTVTCACAFIRSAAGDKLDGYYHHH